VLALQHTERQTHYRQPCGHAEKAIIRNNKRHKQRLIHTDWNAKTKNLYL